MQSNSLCEGERTVEFDEQVDAGLKPEQFGRIWLHTHPGNAVKDFSGVLFEFTKCSLLFSCGFEQNWLRGRGFVFFIGLVAG